MRVTTYDIARTCGVSQATVDRALNNRSNIKPKTKELILKTASEMGYRPSNLPKYLKTGKTNIIGILFPTAAVDFYSRMIVQLTNIFKAHGYNTCVSFSDGDTEQEKEYLAEFLKMNVDGIILIPCGSDGTEVRKIIAAGTPVVTLVSKFKNYNFDFVSIDYAKVSEQAIQYLIDLGHRRISYYAAGNNFYTYNRRLKGYENALKNNNLPINPRFIIRDDANDYQMLHELLQREERPTAFYCFNDLVAIALVSRLNSIGLSAPRDFSIIGFDNSETLRYFTPRLTSIAYPYREMCDAAAEILLGKIKNPSAEEQSCILDGHMVLGESCGNV